MTRNKIPFWKACLCSACIMAGILTLNAGPAKPGIISFTQSDGTRIRIRVHGDEFYNFTTTADGYTLAGGPDGDWYFARMGEDGQPVPSEVKAKPVGKLTAEERRILGADLRKGIRPAGPTEFQRRLRESASAGTSVATRSETDTYGVPPLLGGTSWKPVGQKKVLVILVEYPDVAFTKGSRDAFDQMLNSRSYTAGGATGSAWQYYYENSGGKFDPVFTVAGPYTLDHERSWYKNDKEDKTEQLVKEAAQKADADVNFADFAENGTVHDIFIFYAGKAMSDGEPNAIWPHRSTIAAVTLDGVQLCGYACSSELEVNGKPDAAMAPIGSFCHEFGHTIGWPDFYDTNSYTGKEEVQTPSFFSLMDYGTYNNESRTPPALSILERWMMGWDEPTVIEDAGEITVRPVTEGEGYLVRTKKDGDYFLLECRGAGRTVWDNPTYLDYYGYGAFQDWGLLVYHVNAANSTSWITNSVNSTVGSEKYRLVYSNGNSESGYIAKYLPTHCFFGSKVTSLYSNAETGFVSADGGKTEVELISITVNAAEGTVTLKANTISGNITNVTSSVFQHDAVILWDDNLSDSWNVSWKAADGSGEGELTGLTSREAHIGALKAGQTYEVTIESNKNARYSSTLTTSKPGSGLPRIVLSDEKPSSSASVLLTLADCGDYSAVQWKVDGANTGGWQTLKQGERRIQAIMTKADGTKEYFERYVTVLNINK